MTPEQGYAAARELHERRVRQGWRPVGRKIGFTNRKIWPIYGVYEPIWGTVYDRTVVDAEAGACTVSLDGLAQPRIEPEICFGLGTPPRSSSPADLVASIEWIAHSIEVVQCAQPGWKGVTVANSAAENALHGRLVVGAPVPAWPDLADRLPAVEIELRRDGTLRERGRGENVLGSPLAALGHLVELLARQPWAPPLAAGEIVSTGTLTDAHPVAPGETWSTEVHGLPLKGLTVRFT